MRSQASRTSRGFTLLEMLVVLLITSMVTGLLMNGLLQVFRLQERFGAETFNTQQGAMQTAWFRQTVNGLTPDYADGKNLFHGETRALQGLTLAPLNLAEGTLAPFAWRLRFDSARGETLLLHGTDQAPTEILSWPGNTGRFEFLDAEGAAHDSWPPFLGKWPQMPSAIRLTGGDSSAAKVIIAVPKGPLAPAMRLKDVEG